jgi:lysophospholipase L1-like esterase
MKKITRSLSSVLVLTAIIILTGILMAFTHRPLVWVAIGDSITYLNEHPDETGNRITKGYLTDVTERLPYIHYVNQGHNGWTTANIAKAIDNLGIPVADVYSVFLGTNDWWQGNPIGDWRDYEKGTGDSTVYGSFRILINKLRSLNGKATIVLITPMPRTDFVYILDAKNNAYGSYRDKNGQTLEQVAQAVLAIGSHEHFQVVDLYHSKQLAVPRLVRYKRLKDPKTGAYRDYPYPDYVGLPFQPDTDEYPYPVKAEDMTYDGLHPSDKGHALIAKHLIKILRKI